MEAAAGIEPAWRRLQRRGFPEAHAAMLRFTSSEPPGFTSGEPRGVHESEPGRFTIVNLRRVKDSNPWV